jgi:sugar (pentulose or hexulose) kinase
MGADGHFLTQDGDVLGKVYCYRDHRLDTMCDEVKARIDAERVYAITGNHFQPFNQSNQLLWVATRRPELLKLAKVYLPIPRCSTTIWAAVRRWIPRLPA